MIFIAAVTSEGALQFFSMPFHCLRGITIKQDAFGANYIKGMVAPEGGTYSSFVSNIFDKYAVIVTRLLVILQFYQIWC